MDVENPMTKLVVCLSPKNSIKDAYWTMEETKCRHLPIISSGKVVGIVSNRDLLLHAKIVDGVVEMEDKPVECIMTKNPITGLKHFQVSRVVDLLVNNKIDCLPIVDDEDKLEGIITTTDLLLLLKMEFSAKIPFHFNIKTFNQFQAAV